MSTEPASESAFRPSAAAAAARWPRGTVAAVLLAWGGAMAAAALLDAASVDSGALARNAALVGGVGAALVLWFAGRHLKTVAFGAANAVTLARGALVVVLVASLAAGAAAAWWLVALAVLAVSLDGVDGALARRRGATSAFGARFDMETDAVLILVLAALVWQLGKAGAWILLAGLLRYLFVAASYAWPWLAAALPPSRRRQAVCVLQIASLIGALAPVVAVPWSAALALAGLAALVWSFAVDVAWLARHARS